MATVRTKFTVGLFLIAGTLLAVAAVIWIGMSGYLEKGRLYILYFDESVQGLNADSTVKYRGVAIGRVESIGVAPDGTLIEVTAKIEKPLDNVKELAGKLKVVGITGIMFIELDKRSPNAPAQELVLPFEPPHPVIATEPSDIKQIFDEVNNFIARLRAVDWEGLIASVRSAVDSFRAAADNTDTKAISARLVASLDSANRIMAQIEKSVPQADKAVGEGREAMQGINEVVERLNGILKDNERALNSTLENLAKVMEEAGRMAEKGGGMVAQTDARLAQLQHELLLSTRNLEAATESLNQLLEDVSQDPGLLITREPPPVRSREAAPKGK
jgi:phospholipid/cholesterol/gamma-HCH transport system substrate-binding protein